ncbi:MAG: hypothetical protein RJA07_1832 [Bacteroidota bacterium]|jgi:DNA-binding response OmpR family regulator
MRILIVEDEKSISTDIVNYLKPEGYKCDTAFSYAEAEDKILSAQYDIVLLDITLPMGNGLDLIPITKQQHPQTGILIISAKNSVDDKINGLDLGADDYITKPFFLTEINARVKSVIRRRQHQNLSIIQFEEITISPADKSVRVNTTDINITKSEYDILLYFVVNKNRLVTKQALADHLLGAAGDELNSYDLIYSHIKNLRKKLIDAGATDYIKTIYAMGYKFTNQ